MGQYWMQINTHKAMGDHNKGLDKSRQCMAKPIEKWP